MSLNRNRLYVRVIIASVVGYVWILLQVTKNNFSNNPFRVCFLKQITNIPCPSCGTTRSVTSIIQGHFLDALYSNPLGYLIFIVLLISPFWILKDLFKKTNTFLQFYIKILTTIKKPKIAFVLIVLVILNWIWNINKGL
ncbi:DUF2752 domain-containing protein [uncultured Polaribacter sp.]|uniref:DUF2752 domain-containing protein n=1 Tax=uncultured Polaribacter sp. TaxID=174711 RepID=UPI002601A0BA|nr:DUF2752 domain-containing protein [uncultured Polaribacter sp.]